MSELPVIDESALDHLKELGGENFVGDMVKMFFDYSDEKLAAAREALAVKDIDLVEKAIHPLKTSAGHVGAARMKKISQEIEKRARESDCDLIPDLLVRLEAAYAEVKPLLEPHLPRA